MMTRQYDLEERLISFSLDVIEVSKTIITTNAGYNLSNQLVRSSSSPALNYGEAQSAESRADFIHKVKIILKELRESFVCLRILNRKKYLPENILLPILKEADELIAIFVKSYKTAKGNMNSEKRR